MHTDKLPIGKLPPELLAKILSQAPIQDSRVLLGPGIGLDCAVIDLGATLLVLKSDPITFASDQIGWYAVQIAANDIATTAAEPRWLLATLLLPEAHSTPGLAQTISSQIFEAARQLGISVIGGHTEVTYGLDRPILMVTLIGEVQRARLVTPRGAQPGDQILLTKGVPIEAAAILAREFAGRLRPHLSEAELEEAAAYLYAPGISIVRDAQIATAAGQVNAMHDPTEGGLAAALWELAEASQRSLIIDRRQVYTPPLSARICRAFGLDPLATIASGALLLSAPPADAAGICQALTAGGIACRAIGRVESGRPEVWNEEHGLRRPLPRPQRDEITKVYES